MKPYPVLETKRLLLRGFAVEDAPEVRSLAGAREVARMTLDIPHPYERGAAEEWISTHRDDFESGEGLHFAILARGAEAAESTLVGAVGLEISARHRSAMLGYWIGVPYWGRGYCTEAADEVIRYGFEELGLRRIHSNHFASNPASGKVMQKLGMTYEGTRREHFEKWGRREDSVEYGLLAEEWLSGEQVILCGHHR